MAAKQRARSRRSESEWLAIVDRFERSGMSATRFSRQAGIPLSTLHFWRRNLGSGNSPKSKLEFVDLRPAGVAPAGAREPGVSLPYGRWTIDVIFPDGTSARMGG